MVQYLNINYIVKTYEIKCLVMAGIYYLLPTIIFNLLLYGQYVSLFISFISCLSGMYSIYCCLLHLIGHV